MKHLKTEWNEFINSGRMPVFEVQIGDEFYLYDVEYHPGDELERKEPMPEYFYMHLYANENFRMSVDKDLSLDEHLQALYDECYNDALVQYDIDMND